MPAIMIEEYLLEYYSENKNSWQTLIHKTLNIQLLKLTVLDTWAGDKAHLFALDIFQEPVR